MHIVSRKLMCYRSFDLIREGKLSLKAPLNSMRSGLAILNNYQHQWLVPINFNQ